MRMVGCFVFLVVVGEGIAAACVYPPPVVIRSVQPEDGSAMVPTSVRVRVTYATGAQGQPLCGTAPPAPILRPATPADGGVTDKDAGVPVDGGTPIAGTWVKATDDDPRVSTVWEFRPAATLQPSTAYELVDAFPETCSCVAGQCRTVAAAVFSRFTTRATADATAPTFAGIGGVVCSHITCSVLETTCCGPYNHLRLDFLHNPASDDVEVGNGGRPHLYLRKDGEAYDFTTPLGPLAYADPSDTFAAPMWFGPSLPPGKYFAIARAVDTSGNEDSNLKEVSFTLPLTADPLCSQVLDASVQDQRPAVDLTAVASDLAGSGDMAAPPAKPSCSCSVGAREQSPAVALAAAGLGLALLGLLSRRARRRSRRGAAGAGA